MEHGQGNLYSFISEQPRTPFAPYWNYHIGEKYLTSIDLKLLSSYILNKEVELINSHPPGSDGGTRLGPNSMTSRYLFYNLLNTNFEPLRQLHKEIKIFHSEYLPAVIGNKWSPPPLHIRCWANVMRKGQKIKKHLHSTHEHTYLGGHFTVACEDSYTIYPNVLDISNDHVDPNLTNDTKHFSKNVPGKLTLFPNYLPHYTSTHKSDKPRITIAFDIVAIDDLSKSQDGENLIPL